jgi:hypothetical protein
MREYRLGKGAADWDMRFPELVSRKHSVGMALVYTFLVLVCYWLLASVLGIPFARESLLLSEAIVSLVLTFFFLDGLRYALFPKSATVKERAWFLVLRVIQNIATYLGLIRKRLFG